MNLGEIVILIVGMTTIWLIGYQWWRSVGTSFCSICGEAINLQDHMCDDCYQWVREGNY